MIKILHTGDFHLDSAFGGLGASGSDTARENQRQNFVNVMNYAADAKADAVLICGDLFDSSYITKATEKLVISALAALPCPVVISPGNHDPYTRGSLYASSKLPENVYVFNSEELQMFSFDCGSEKKEHLQIYGYAFLCDRLEKNPLSDFSADMPGSDGALKILCAHADIFSHDSKYAPITPEKIAHCGFDYAALGHIHKISDAVQYGKTLINYSGFPFGRSFDELDYGGVVLLTADNGTVTAERVTFTSHRYMCEVLDVGGSADSSDICEKVLGLICSRGYGKETFLKVTLCGVVSENCLIFDGVFTDAARKLGQLFIKDETLPMPDIASLEKDVTIKGELYRTLSPQINNGTTEERRTAVEALRIGLAAIDGRNCAELLTPREVAGK